MTDEIIFEGVEVVGPFQELHSLISAYNSINCRKIEDRMEQLILKELEIIEYNQRDLVATFKRKSMQPVKGGVSE